MNQHILMAAALSAGISLVACSRPSSQNDQTGSSTAGRQIELAGAGSSEAPLASDLETRRAPRAARSPAAPRVVAAAATAGQPDAPPTHDHVMGAVAVSVPQVGTTTSVVADPDRELARAPIPSAPSILVSTSFGAAGVSGGPSAGTEPDLPGPINRAPTIIIRGGMGGPHDDCKVHGPGGAPGLAINRITPGFGGGEVRGNTGGRFPRGGIR